MKILLVDDDPIAISILKKSLEKKGFEVDFSLSPEDAAKKLPQSNCDLIMIDFMCPMSMALNWRFGYKNNCLILPLS